MANSISTGSSHPSKLLIHKSHPAELHIYIANCLLHEDYGTTLLDFLPDDCFVCELGDACKTDNTDIDFVHMQPKSGRCSPNLLLDVLGRCRITSSQHAFLS